MGFNGALFWIPILIMFVAIGVEAGVSAVSGTGAVCLNSQGQTSCVDLPKGTTFSTGAMCAVQAFISNIPSGDVYVMACGNNIGNGFPSETMALASTYDLGSASRVGITCAFTACSVFIVPVLSTFPTITFGPGFRAICGGSGGILTGGSLGPVTALTCKTTQDYSQHQSAATTGLFAFVASVSLDSNGWVAVILVAVGAAVIAGLAVLGSGLNAESTHILFIGGLLLGIWFIIIAAEGYPGSGELFFSSLDSTLPGAGAAAFLLLTLMYSVGVISAVSRGSSV